MVSPAPPGGVRIPEGGPQFLGNFTSPQGLCGQGSESLCALHPDHGLLEKMGRSYTCYPEKVYGRWGPSRICRGGGGTPLSRSSDLPPGQECRVGAPPPGRPPLPGSAAGTLHHQPLFRRGADPSRPGTGWLRCAGWGRGDGMWWGRCLRWPQMHGSGVWPGETSPKQMTLTGDQGALTGGPLEGSEGAAGPRGPGARAGKGSRALGGGQEGAPKLSAPRRAG